MPSAARASSAARKPAARREPSRATERAEKGPLIVRIGRQWDGCVYRLHPGTKLRLKAARIRVHSVPTVFIGYTDRAEFEALHGPMWPQIVQMLTGLNPDKLRALGGVELHDPEDESRWRVL